MIYSIFITLLLIFAIPTVSFSNPAITFIPVDNDMIYFLVSRYWLFFSVIIVESIVYVLFIVKPIFKIFLACIIANLISTIPGFFFSTILSYFFDQSHSGTVFNYFKLFFNNFYSCLFSVLTIWIIPLFLSFLLSIAIEFQIIKLMFRHLDLKTLSKVIILSNIASYIFLYLFLFQHYYKHFCIYTPDFIK